MKAKLKSCVLLLVLAALIVYFVRFYNIFAQDIQTINFNIHMEGHQVSLSVRASGNQSEEMVLLTIMDRLKSQGKPILVTVINDAFVPFAHSWLCNTVYMDIHHQVVIFVTDTKSRDEIVTKWPRVHVVALSGSERFHGNQDYSHAGYVKIMVKRTEVILNILKQGGEVLVFEVDAFWRSNPIPECQHHAQGYDIAVIPVSQRTGVVGGGFLYMKPTERMVSLWKELTRRMISLKQKIAKLDNRKAISEGENDQMYLSDLISRKYGGILVKELPLNRFPDGKWFTMNEQERNKYDPIIINNNWIVGNKAKKERAEQFHQWFWDTESDKCQNDLVILKTVTL